jgi:hypothetical protein
MQPTVEANLALVRRTYELWNLGGPADVVFHETPEMPDAGIDRGDGPRRAQRAAP